MDKVMIYIDNSNFFKTARQKYPDVRIDYKRLVAFLLNGREKAEVKIYGSERNPPLAEQSNFYKFLRKCGYLITILPLKTVGTKQEEKGVDMALGMDMIMDGFNEHFTCAVLVSGDRDYARLIERVRRECGWRVEVAFFEFGLSEELRLSAEKFISLSEHINEIKIAR